MVYIKADNIYKYIAEDVGTRFDTSNYELSRPPPKKERTRKLLDKVVGVIAKAYSYLVDAGSKDKKAKDTKKISRKGKPNFENYKKIIKIFQKELNLETK